MIRNGSLSDFYTCIMRIHHIYKLKSKWNVLLLKMLILLSDYANLILAMPWNAEYNVVFRVFISSTDDDQNSPGCWAASHHRLQWGGPLSRCTGRPISVSWSWYRWITNSHPALWWRLQELLLWVAVHLRKRSYTCCRRFPHWPAFRQQFPMACSMEVFL